MSFCAGQSGYKTGWPSCDQEPEVIALILSFRPYIGMPWPTDTSGYERSATGWPASAVTLIRRLGAVVESSSLGACLGHGPVDNRGHDRSVSDTPVLSFT